mmetsp:Transcript_4218/g.8804  ORF Transcript_4218/g.8804 Transcript_4218/m.8804 type:complete len:589 (+) Transcript_4218:131-1897(+)
MDRSRTAPHVPDPIGVPGIALSGSFESRRSVDTRRTMDTRRSSLDPRRLSSFVTRRKATPEEEAQLLSAATSQAMIAAKSMLMSGATPNTALTTAKAAAESILSPKGSNSGPCINRRKAKHQANVVASMALMSAQNDAVATGGLGSPRGGSSVYDMSDIGMESHQMYPHSPMAISPRNNLGYYGRRGAGNFGFEPPSVIPRNFKPDDPSTMGSTTGGASRAGSRMTNQEETRGSGRKMAMDKIVANFNPSFGNSATSSGSGSGMMVKPAGSRSSAGSAERNMVVDTRMDEINGRGNRIREARDTTSRSMKREEDRRRMMMIDQTMETSKRGDRKSYHSGRDIKSKGSSHSRVSKLLDSTHCGTDDDASQISQDEFSKSCSVSRERRDAFSSYSDLQSAAQDSFSTFDGSVTDERQPGSSMMSPFSFLIQSCGFGVSSSNPSRTQKRRNEERLDEQREPLDIILNHDMHENDEQRNGENGKPAACDNASMKSLNSSEIVRALESFERERLVPGTSMKQPGGGKAKNSVEQQLFRALVDEAKHVPPSVESTSAEDGSAPSGFLKKMSQKSAMAPKLARWRLSRKSKTAME